MKNLLSVMVAALFVTATSSAITVNVPNTDKEKTEQKEKVSPDQQVETVQAATLVSLTKVGKTELSTLKTIKAIKKRSAPVYYGWDMSNPSNPVYRRIDGPLEINEKCDAGTNDCVLESQDDHGETISAEDADNFGLTPAQGSSPEGQYLFD
ncbi:hypothetical protein [Parapedobacter defluvii]|nr:hypothetical protein [Parapedobacter defluvii]